MRVDSRRQFRRFRRSVCFETLEDRRVCAISAQEQYFVYRINYARDNPVRYQTERELAVDLSYVTPRGPLAVVDSLFASSEAKVNDMTALNYFAHQSPGGVNANLLVRNNGYALPQQLAVNGSTYINADSGNSVESLAGGQTTVDNSLEALIVDTGVNPPGHRNHLLGITEPATVYNEVGVGYTFNNSTTYKYYWAIHAAARDPSQTFVTGVVYDDSNNNSKYDQGEGLSGVTVDIPATGQSTTSNAAGGWAISVPAGEYEIRASGGAFSGSSTVPARVTTQSIEVDFRRGRTYGQIAFANWVNTAPILNTAPNPTFGPVFTTNPNLPTGSPVSSLIATTVSDSDAVAKRGIAITGTNNPAGGQWQYSVSGTWITLPAVADSSALLLRENDLLRYLPGSTTGAVTLSYRAWDQTTGTFGTTTNLTGSTGGSTAFSSATETATLQVLTANSSPVLVPTGNRTLSTISEDTTNPSGNLVSAILGNTVSDNDAGTRVGLAVSSFTGNGEWQYSSNSGGSWQALPALTPPEVLPLRDSDQLRFVSAANFNGSATISYFAWDQTYGTAGNSMPRTAAPPAGQQNAFSSVSDTASVTVTAANDAPTLAAGFVSWLNPIAVNTGFNFSGGTLVSELLGQSFGDPDVGALSGIAVTGSSGSGTWWFQNDGSWRSGTTSDSSAWLLKSTDRVQFVPNNGFTGTATISYRGWDQTTGPEASGIWANVSSPSKYGGSTAYSVDVQTGTIFVGSAGVAPALSTITLADPNPPLANSARFTVTFSESVVNVSPGDFVLQKIGSANGVVASVSGSGTSYTVTVNQITGSGKLGLALDPNRDIRDSLGNRALTTAPGTSLQYDISFTHVYVSLNTATISENAGANATTGTVTIEGASPTAVTVNLASSDPSEATVPVSVTIPAGQLTATFAVAAVDDNLLDGVQLVTISGTALGYIMGSANINVADHETLAISVFNNTISENNGTTSVTIVRSISDTSTALTVDLLNSNPSTLTAPAQVTIPAGQSSVTFSVSALDDTVLDGNQVTQLTPAATGYESAAATITVTDAETLSVTVDVNPISEFGGIATGTIRRNNTDIGAPLTVMLASSNPSAATVSPQVTIPVGQSTAMFTITGTNDNLVDGSQTTTITATSLGYASASTVITVTDDDFSWQNSPQKFDVNDDDKVDIKDVLALVYYFNFGGVGPIPDGPPVLFYDVTGDREFDIRDLLAIVYGYNNPSSGEGEPSNSNGEIINPASPNSDVLNLLAWNTIQARKKAASLIPPPTAT